MKEFGYRSIVETEQKQMSRRAFLKLAGATAAGVLLASSNEHPIVQDIQAEQINSSEVYKNSQRAFLSYRALKKHYEDRDHLLEYPKTENTSLATNWPYSHAIGASLDLYGIEKDGAYKQETEKHIQGLDYYWTEQNLPGYRAVAFADDPGNEQKYHDDNAWVGLNLMRAYHIEKDPFLIERSKQLFDSALSGFDTEFTCGTGGVYWQYQDEFATIHDKNTISTAPNAQLGLRIFQATGENYYLDNAHKMYSWVNQEMKDPTDGLYWDHINKECEPDKTKWTYNQGVMIGAHTMLYSITEDEDFLSQAEEIASRSLNHFDTEKLLSQPPEFNAIYFRNLLYLSNYSKNMNLTEEIQTQMQIYADHVWNDPDTRDQTGLFRFENNAKLITQAAMIEIYAMLSWNSNEYDARLL